MCGEASSLYAEIQILNMHERDSDHFGNLATTLFPPGQMIYGKAWKHQLCVNESDLA